MENLKTFKKGDKVFFLDNEQPICAFVINAADADGSIIVEEVISLVTRKMTSNKLFSSREEAIEDK